MSTSSRGLEAAYQPQVAVRPCAWLPLGAVVGAFVFTLAWLVLGAVSPGYTVFGVHIAPYSPIAQPISGLGMGVTAPYMNTAFVLSGLAMFAGVVGICTSLPSRPAGRWLCGGLLALTPIGLILAGLFDLESPMLHYVGALFGLGSPVLSFLVTGLILRSIPGWRRLGTGLLLASPISLVLLVVFFAGFDQATTAANQGIAGLTQRVLVLEEFAWFVALGWFAYTLSRRS
jgi:Protein of unknown function (DUF998)